MQGSTNPRARRDRLCWISGLATVFIFAPVVRPRFQPVDALPQRAGIQRAAIDLSGTTWSLRGTGKLKGDRFRQHQFAGRTKQAFDQSLVCAFGADGSFVLENPHGRFVGEGTWRNHGKKAELDLTFAPASCHDPRADHHDGPGSILGGVPSPAGVGMVDVESWSMRCRVKTDKIGRSTIKCVTKFKIRLEGEYLSYEFSGNVKANGALVATSDDVDPPASVPVSTRVRTTQEDAIVYLRDGQVTVRLDADLANEADGVHFEWVKTSGPRGDQIDTFDAVDALPTDVTVSEEGVYLYELRGVGPNEAESIAAQAAIEVREPVSARLSWTSPRRNENGSNLRNLAGFRVYHGVCVGPSAGSCHSEVHRALLGSIDIGRNPSVTIPNLESGETYFFFVTSYTSAGAESDPSGLVFKTVP